MKRLARPFIVLLSLGVISMSWAQSATHPSPYINVSPVPNVSQQNPLQQQVALQFPETVKNTEQAIAYLLVGSGFTLSDKAQWDESLKALMQTPLAVTQQTLGPLPLQQALLTLAGPAFQLLVDPVHRKIAFRLRPDFQKLYGDRPS